MNINNFAQKSNFMCGSSKLEIPLLFLRNAVIPGVSFSGVEVGGRYGVKTHLQSDIATFNSITLEILVDEDYQAVLEILKVMRNNYNPKNGTFANKSFDFWIQINNSKGYPLFKVELVNCKILSISDITLESMGDELPMTINIDLSYDYYEIENLKFKDS